MNYYIADLHIGSINNHDKRSLVDDEFIIHNWNQRVKNNDTVYILGDIGCNRDINYFLRTFPMLKGRRVLIVGNHDVKMLKDQRINQLFSEICDYKDLTDTFEGKSYKIVLSHYPILMWRDQHKGAIHLYGHVHESREYDIYKNSLSNLNQYFKEQTDFGYTDCPQAVAINVGAMLPYMDNTPRTLKELLELKEN